MDNIYIRCQILRYNLVIIVIIIKKKKTETELLEFKRSAETCPKSGLHNPIKNPERYFMYGEICHKAAYLLGHPLIEDYFTQLI
jgi:1-pyrroline-5-carboxylate dehydrogenase